MNIEDKILEIDRTQKSMDSKLDFMLSKLFPESHLLTPKEAEQLTGKKRSTLNRWAKLGKLTIKEGNGNRKYKLIKPQKVKSETITVNKKKVAQYSL